MCKLNRHWRREYEARLTLGNVEPKDLSDVGQHSQRLRELRQLANTQRQALTDLRARRVIGDDAFHIAEAEIDLLDLSADARIHPDAGGREPGIGEGFGIPKPVHD